MYSKKFRVTIITLTVINIICYMLYMREDNHQIYGDKYIKQEYAIERYVVQFSFPDRFKHLFETKNVDMRQMLMSEYRS